MFRLHSIIIRLGFVFFLLVSCKTYADSVIASNPQTIRIKAIEQTKFTDILVIDGGLDNNLRQNMVVTVLRGKKMIGQLLLVDLRQKTASALIFALNNGDRFLIGDSVTVKPVSIRNQN